MKALFNRTFNRSSSLKDRDGKEAALAHTVAASITQNSNSNSNLSTNANHVSNSNNNNNVPTLPPLPVWPPSSSSAPQRPLSSISQSSLKPLPEIVPHLRPLPPIFDEAESVATSSVSGDVPRNTFSTVTTSTSKSNGDSTLQQQPKKVAFIAPASAPSSPLHSLDNNTLSFERKYTNSVSDQSQVKQPTRSYSSADSSTPVPYPKTSQSVLKVINPSIGSTSSPPNTVSSVSRSLTSNSTTSTTNTTTSASRGLSTPSRGTDIPVQKESSSTIRSGTPYSVMSANTSRILATASWSEAAEEDLVSNLGPRERTRQEVLWEIVASEERYVAELLKMKETFIDPLLHPFAAVPAASATPDIDYSSPRPISRAEVPSRSLPAQQPQEYLDRLPIAARFLSPLSFDGPTIQQQQQQQQSLRLASTPIIEGESDEEDAAGAAAEAAAKMNHPRSPYRNRATTANPVSALNAKIGMTSSSIRPGRSVPFPSRSHHSLPPPPRAGTRNPTTISVNPNIHPALSSVSLDERDRVKRDHNSTASQTQDQGSNGVSRISRKLKKSQPNLSKQGDNPNILANSNAIPPHLLPDDLRRCLEVIENGIVNGHFLLSEGLRKRYEEQYPLVRSLADVFVSHSHILREYATYVLHLERALEQVDDALSLIDPGGKRSKKHADADSLKLSRYLQRLEETASDRGETGLAISLSKPFQRLLKYPLLFQNLLFHTDPSTYEYESTLQMVAEVETIVRSIEDEKIQKEERDRTRDVLARIEGLDKIKQLAVPKPSRLLVEERMLSIGEGGSGAILISGSPGRDTPLQPAGSNSAGKSNLLSTPPSANKNVKGKSSFRRLSDVLQPGGSSGVGGKKDLWLVVFNDVVLRCQRTGTTSLPLSFTTAVTPSTGSGAARTASLPDLGKTKYATTGRRNSHTKPRNLYKFLKIETWAMSSDAGASANDNKRVGIVSMEDISRSRAQASSTVAPGPSKPIIAPMPEEDEDDYDSSDSDRKSKMSFSYWGADKVTLSHQTAPSGSGSSANGRTSVTAGGHHKVKTRAPLSRGTVRGRPIAPSSYTSRESSANAKFGSRLVGGNASVHGPGGDTHPPRSASRKATTTPNGSTRRANTSNASTTVTTTSSNPSDDHKPTAATRPAWDGSTKATSTTSTTSVRRPRNISQTSANPKVGADTVRTVKVSSSAPSEDSGVGLYRQMMAQDPSINR